MTNFAVFLLAPLCFHGQMRIQRRYIRHWLLVLAWLLVIFGASSDSGSSNRTSRIIGPIVRFLYPQISEESLSWVVLAVRKAAHVTEYAILAVLVWRAIRASRAAPGWSWQPRDAAIAWGAATLYAASDEIHQLFVPSRTGQVQDVLIDSTGAALGLLAVFLCLRWRARRDDCLRRALMRT